MTLFKMTWLRNFVRRNTNPVPMNTAKKWKQRLSIGYAILAWNAFGFVLYAVFTGRADWAKAAGLKSEAEANLPPAVAFAKQFNINKANVIRISGFSEISQYEIDNTKDEDATESEE